MSEQGWIAVWDRKRGPLPVPAGDVEGDLTEGAFDIRFTYTPDAERQNLIRFAVRDPELVTFIVRLDPDGQVHVMTRRGDQASHHVVQIPPVEAGEPIHLRSVWRADGSGVLALHAVHADIWAVASIPGVVPMTRTDVHRMMHPGGAGRRADCVHSHSVANCAMPIGPTCDLDGSGQVLTQEGPMRLADVRPGQSIITETGAAVRVMWVGQVSEPGVSVSAPVHLQAPYYGLRQDMIMAREARIVLGGSDIEYLFAEDRVSVRVQDLCDGRAMRPVHNAGATVYTQVLLDRPAVFDLSGAKVSSFDPKALLGDELLRRHSVLAGLPPELISRDEAEARVELRPFEAISLRGMRAA